jgi:hypothetical protein
MTGSKNADPIEAKKKCNQPILLRYSFQNCFSHKGMYFQHLHLSNITATLQEDIADTMK